MNSVLFGSGDDILNSVDTDVVVGPASEQESSVLVPGEGSAAEGLLGVSLVGLHGGLGDLLEDLGGGEVEDLDAVLGTDDEPVELLGEEHAVDGGLEVLASEPLALEEVPDDDVTVTGSGGEVGGTVDHIESVNLSLVAGESVHEVHVQVVPDLDGSIPRGSDADGRLLGVVELNAGNGISVLVLVDGMLALRTGVPDLDLSVESSSNDLSVIVGEGNREDISGVTNELGDSSSLLNGPETDGTIPGGGESESGVAGENNLGDEVGVASEHLLGVSGFSVFIIVLFVIKFPLNESLVTGSGKQEFNSLSVHFFFTNSEGGNPAAMTLEESDLFKRVLYLFLIFSH